MNLELHLFDFDGTLFRSPLPPDGYTKSWWGQSYSLEPPCVPMEPDNSWWIMNTIQRAKKSIAAPNVWAILCTGRAKTTKLTWRVADLLKQQGLNFDEVYLNPGGDTRKYKQYTIGKLLQKFPDIKAVHIWEDNLPDLASFVKFVEKNFGIPCIPHPIKEKPHKPECDAQRVLEWREEEKARKRERRRVATRYMDATKNQNSLNLIHWLGKQSSRLGLSEHVYVVGGAVRNFLINRPIKDVDVMIDTISSGRSSGWLADRLANLIPAQTNVTTNQYGVGIISVKGDWFLNGENLKGEVIEIAEARSESYTDADYRPEVERATIEEDALRREFTFNTLMWRLSDVAKGVDKAKIIDITGCGIRDLKKGEMRCPSDPNRTFSDDPTRMVRAVKFLIKYGFKIPPETKRAIKNNAHLLKRVPPSAVSNLLINDVLMDDSKVKEALIALDGLDLMEPIRSFITDNREFKRTLENWAKTLPVQQMLDILDLGVPINTKLNFLDQKQQTKFRKAVMDMERDEALEYLEGVKSPQKAIHDRSFLPNLARERGIVGKRNIGLFMRDIMDRTRELILDDPSVAFHSDVLKKAIRERV